MTIRNSKLAVLETFEFDKDNSVTTGNVAISNAIEVQIGTP